MGKKVNNKKHIHHPRKRHIKLPLMLNSTVRNNNNSNRNIEKLSLILSFKHQMNDCVMMMMHKKRKLLGEEKKEKKVSAWGNTEAEEKLKKTFSSVLCLEHKSNKYLFRLQTTMNTPANHYLKFSIPPVEQSNKCFRRQRNENIHKEKCANRQREHKKNLLVDEKKKNCLMNEEFLAKRVAMTVIIGAESHWICRDFIEVSESLPNLIIVAKIPLTRTLVSDYVRRRFTIQTF
ncbi:CLUMA_CG020538, isoform A [Clunio marinus]|uniref:CLUMA_CG020538, isoform A n=1 Tax=Clunio marinus TaxID=568069 RepID=A0A1J1J587_9DIPT|nr:CLUMA_CG020538, isoform A [Clunio marinus]